MPFRQSTICCAILWLTLFASHFPSFAQVAEIEGSTADSIKARIEFLNSEEGATTPDAGAAVVAWTESVATIDERSKLSEQRQQFVNQIESYPHDLNTVTQALADTDVPLEPSVAEDTTLEEIAGRQAEVTAKLEAERKLVDDLTAQRDRELQIPAQLTDIQGKLDRLPSPAQPPTTASELEKAQYERTLQQRLTLAEHIRKLEAEREFYRVTADLLTARIELASRRVANLEQLQEDWRQLAEERRAQADEDSRATATSLKEQYAQVPALKPIADETAELAARRSSEDGLLKSIATASLNKTKAEARLKEIKSEREGSQRRVLLLEAAGLPLDRKVGELLTRQKQKLESAAELQSRLSSGLRASAEAEMEMLALSEQGQEAAAESAQTIARLHEAVRKQSPESAIGEEDIRTLVENRQKILGDLAKEYSTLTLTLRETNEITKVTIDEVTDFRRFLDERLLWAPNVERISRNSIGEEWAAVRDLMRDFPSRWLGVAFLAIIVGVSAVARRPVLGSLQACGEAAARRNCTSFAPTMEAVLLSLLLAAPVPLLLAGLAWLTPSEPFSTGLQYAAYYSLLMGFALACCRPGGLMEAHLNLDPARAARIYRNLFWFFPVMLPFIFLAAALFEPDSSSGRLIFILAMGLFAVLAIRLFLPRHQLIQRKGRPSRLAKLWFALALLIPIGLSVGAALGYYSSVQTLRVLLVSSMWLILITWAITQLLLRWALVSRRRLAIDQALRRREAFLAERKRAEETGDPSSRSQDLPSLEEVKAEAVNVAEVQEQTARLTRAAAVTALAFGLWAIWAPTLPALSLLDKVTVWPGSAQTAVETSSPTDTTLPATPNAGEAEETAGSSSALPTLLQPATGGVSVHDILMSLIAIVLTFVAARNVPGLLELTLLRRLNLKPGGSFAFTTTVRYAIILAGVLIAFGKIGITWSNVQWIAAAVTVGIGFGLQEVFANFVAGLILLFERPIRLGDVVTIGDASGRVTQIRIRATTILQFNNRELIVPNKDLITGTLINWTLTDGVLRLEVPVGIAYGSNTEQARELLLEVARSNSRILKEPAPDVVFSAFADSALNFELRAHVGSIGDLLPAKNELFFAVDEAFREAGIEIAFPQTDIHIRSVPEGIDVGRQAVTDDSDRQ